MFKLHRLGEFLHLACGIDHGCLRHASLRRSSYSMAALLLPLDPRSLGHQVAKNTGLDLSFGLKQKQQLRPRRQYISLFLQLVALYDTRDKLVRSVVILLQPVTPVVLIAGRGA